MRAGTAITGPRLIGIEGLGALYQVLADEGYCVIGPAVQDGAIMLRELPSASELPSGWGVRLGPGGYRLRRRDDRAAFGHSAGPQSWKTFLHPPRERLRSAARTPYRGAICEIMHKASPRNVTDPAATSGVRRRHRSTAMTSASEAQPPSTKGPLADRVALVNNAGAGPAARSDTGRPVRQAGGSRAHRGVPRLRRLVLHHRADLVR